jgi:two-component system chemotaxis response regulator CheB
MNPAGAHAPDTRIRVMVVDDSAIVRGLVVRMLESEPGIVVTATCSNGEMAVREIGRRPCDVVVLDIEMPVLDGLATLPKLLAAAPGVRILMASTLTQRNAEISLEALARGASDYIPKPTTGQLGGSAQFRQVLLEKVLALGRRKPATPAPYRAKGAEPAKATGWTLLPAAAPRRPQIVAIGSSTGGPQALMSLLAGLPPGVDAPIVIAQHMPPTFTTILAQHLSRVGPRPGAEATDGETVLPGRVYLAPGDFHMELDRCGSTLKVRLTREPPENFCRPSVNPLFRSVARLFGGRAAGVMLTGMGSDGLDGARDLVRAGGSLVAQDEASSVVWGMPGAVAQAGLCHAVLPLAGIAPYLAGLFEKARP